MIGPREPWLRRVRRALLPGDFDGRPLQAAWFSGHLREAFEFAVETRRFEIERFWQRSLFFWGFIAASFIAFGTLAKEGDWRDQMLVGCFGIVASLAWTLQNRGAKYWQEAWERKVEALETSALGAALFRNPEPRKSGGLWSASRFSVSRLTIAFSDFTFLGWLVLTLSHVEFCLPDPRGGDWIVFFSLLLTGLYCFALFGLGRSERRHD